jgi:hypothetical protein
MKLLLTGLQPDFDLDVLRQRMTKFGTVVDVKAVRDGDPDRPWAIVDMGLGVAEATEVARRIDGIYYIDRFIRAQVLLHG